MSAARVFMLPRAEEAILQQANYYEEESGSDLATRWHLAIDQAIRNLALFPQLGALCRLSNPALANLRRIPVSSFEKLLNFYRDLPESHAILVVHVLHGARDIEAILTESWLS